MPPKVWGRHGNFGIWLEKMHNSGWTILLDRAEQVRVHKLVYSHGMDLNLDRFLRVDLRDCPLCVGDLPRPEVHSDPR